MKKLFKVLIYAILIIGGFYLVNEFILKSDDNYNAFYLVPDDAVFIIESDKPFDAWDDIIYSNAWNKISNIEFFNDLNNDLQGIDSIVSSNRILLKIFGSRKVLVSCHEAQNRIYDYLFIVDLNNVSKINKLKKYFSNILGEDYSFNIRKYKDYEIFDLYDKKSSEIYYFSFVKDQLIFSKTFVLIESSIDQTEILKLARDMNFIHIFKKVSGKGLFNVYLNYKYLLKYTNSLLGKSNDFIKTLSESLHYTGISFTIDEEGLIQLEGFTNTNDSVNSVYKALIQSGGSKTELTDVVPKRVASMVKIGFDDVNVFYESMQKAIYDESTTDQLKKTEKRLKISIKENLLSWIDNEIGIIQTQPSNLGKDNEFAAILKAKNKKSAQENMGFITQQIKKSTPVQFKEIEYRDYKISYISFPGIFKMLFGKMLSKIEKPYFTIIEKYVILSNHPQTLKSIIDDYLEGNTLSGSSEYYNFLKNFNTKSTVHVYLNTPVLFNNIQGLVGYNTWMNIKKNKEYINCFPQVGIQLNSIDEVLRLSIYAQYEEETEEFIPVRIEEDLFPDQTVSDSNQAFSFTFTIKEDKKDNELVINDLDAGKQELYYDNGQLRISVGLKNGLKQGIYKEFYEDGKIKIKGRYKDDNKTGSWKYYDMNGELENELEY